MFSTFRHKNISLLATLQSCEQQFKPIVENCGIIIIMNTFGYQKWLESIFRQFIGGIHVPHILRSILPKLNPCRYIVINLTISAMKNKNYLISNDLFTPVKGYTKSEIESIYLST